MIRLLTFYFLFALSPLSFAQPVILVFGDSLSAGYGLNQGEGWVQLLQSRLNEKKYPHQVINASISGNTTDNGRDRIVKTLAKHKPDVVIIELGGNDGLRGLSLAAMRKNLSFIVQACQQQKAKVLLVGIRLPPNYGPLYVQKFQQSFAFVAEEHEIPIVPYMLDIIGEDYRYFQRDRIHPNRLGQPIILDNIWPQLEKLL